MTGSRSPNSRLAALFGQQVRRVPPRGRVFQLGDPAQSLFLLRNGFVKLTSVSATGDEIIIKVYAPGDMFGELSFHSDVQQFYATALIAAEISEIPTSRVVEAGSQSADVLPEVAGWLASRIARAYAELQELLYEPLLIRLGRKLVQLARARVPGRQWLELPPAFHHEELAQMTGVRRETVVRAMHQLRELGLIETVRGRVRVHRVAMERFLTGGWRSRAEAE